VARTSLKSGEISLRWNKLRERPSRIGDCTAGAIGQISIIRTSSASSGHIEAVAFSRTIKRGNEKE
jgi:hypothetical protein